MMSPFRTFCILGSIVYLLLIFLVEKKTGIPFISNGIYLSLVSIIWIVICIIIGIIRFKNEDDEHFKY
jgi:uncharacterized membrane protein